MVDGVLYATNAVGLAEAFDPETGRTIWTQKIAGDRAAIPGSAARCAPWPTGATGSERRVFTYHKQYLYALNPKTGEPIGDFGSGGRVDLSLSSNGQYLWNAPPLVVRDVVIIGSSMADQDSATKMEGAAGEVRAFDVRTGQAALDLPRHPARGRARRRNVGERVVEIHRRRATSGRR